MLLRLAEMLPRDKTAVLACCVPTPILVRRYINQVFDIICEARKQPLKTVNNTIAGNASTSIGVPPRSPGR